MTEGVWFGGAASEVNNNLVWQKMAIVWRANAKNRILIRYPLKAALSSPLHTFQITVSNCLLFFACRLLSLCCFFIFILLFLLF